MKKQITIIAAFIVAAVINVQATTWTVSNNPNSPGQFTGLQAAIDASQPHDTILVSGSNTSYGTITLVWPLTIIGAGYNNPYGLNSTIETINLNRFNQTISASGSSVMGFIISSVNIHGWFSGGTAQDYIMENIVIERCWIRNLSFSWGTTVKNSYIRNNIFWYTPGGSGHAIIIGTSDQYSIENIYIINNIFGSLNPGGRYVNSTTNADLSSVFVRNNLFLGSPQHNIFNEVTNMVIENNIFYAANPQGATGAAFNNNITYLNANNVIPGPNNIGSGNLVDVNPQFVSYPPLGGAFDWSHNYNLQPGSPGKNAGTDGTDIGIYGGMAPFEVGANPYIPQMMEVNMPSGSSVPAGGTLNVQFKARKQD